MKHLCKICLGTDCPHMLALDASHAPFDARKRLEAIEAEWAENLALVDYELLHPDIRQDRPRIFDRCHDLEGWLPLVRAVLEDMRMEDAR